MTTGIVIPAHMGSTRFPGKPLALVGGKPLLSYAVDAARESGLPWCVATSDHDVEDWCIVNIPLSESKECNIFVTEQCTNGTERAAIVNKYAKWDRVIVLQCDEPDVTGDQLRYLSTLTSPCTMVTWPDVCDWGNMNTVFAAGLPDEFSGETSRVAMYFRRGVSEEADCYYRHVGVYLYDSNLLSDYLQTSPTPAEQNESLEQLRTMALGYAWLMMTIPGPLRSVNVPADVEKFTEDARLPVSQS